MKLSQAEMLDRMADHVLAHGLTQATLRPLASAAGTSDRMLIYHFGTKEGVIGALLDHLAKRFMVLLEAVPLPVQASAGDLVPALWPLMQAPAGAPYVRLWLEVVAGAARGVPGYRQASARILGHFQHWIRARLPQDDDATAAFLLAAFEGLVVLAAADAPDGALVASALAGLDRRYQ